MRELEPRAVQNFHCLSSGCPVAGKCWHYTRPDSPVREHVAYYQMAYRKDGCKEYTEDMTRNIRIKA